MNCLLLRGREAATDSDIPVVEKRFSMKFSWFKYVRHEAGTKLPQVFKFVVKRGGGDGGEGAGVWEENCSPTSLVMG